MQHDGDRGVGFLALLVAALKPALGSVEDDFWHGFSLSLGPVGLFAHG